jgi:hypothetical protein
VTLGVDIDSRTARKVTPLHYAAGHGQAEAVRTLVALGADKQARTAQGWTPLHSAARNGHVEALQMLMVSGADIEAKAIDGATPLHIAAYNGHVETMQALVARGADMQAKTLHGDTPLHSAACNGHLELLKALLVLGADKQATNTFGETPLQLSRSYGHTQLEQVLRSQPTRSRRKGKAPVTRECTQEEIAAAARMGDALIEEEERAKAKAVKGKVSGVLSDAVGCGASALDSACDVLWASQGEPQPQPKRKGKAKAGAGGGPSNQMAAVSSGGEASTSRGGDGPSVQPSASAHVCSTVHGQAVPPSSAESVSRARPKHPPARAAGSTKQEKELQRSERVRQRKIDQAKEMLNVAMEVMEQSGVR